MALHIAAAGESSRCNARRRAERCRAFARAVVLAAVGLLNSAGAPTAHSAQAHDGWIGKRVVPKSTGMRLKIENRVIVPRVLATYRVEQVNGPWLWLEPEPNGQSGWAPADQLVPIDEANAFFTDCIRSNPGDDFAYSMRAIVRGDVTHELEGALADYNEAIRLGPTNAYNYCNRGLFWSDKKDYDKAIADYNEAIRLDPQSAVPYYDRGLAWSGKKDYDRAIADYNDAIRLDPKYAKAYYDRGLAWSRKKDFENAIADYSAVIQLDPKYARAYTARGNAWYGRNGYDRAIADYNEAVKLDPKNALVYNNRGGAWSCNNNHDQAIADYAEAIRLDPNYAAAYNNRGEQWTGKKAYDRAIADYNEAIRLDPKLANAYCGRAWLWATCPDATYRNNKKAVESATTACDLTEWNDACSLNTLAAAHAEAGEFDAAVKCQTKANALYSDAEERKKGDARLELYREKKPYRDV